MEPQTALKIIQSLANGADPQTGEVLPSTSPYQNAEVVRALFVATQALEQWQERQKRQQTLPENAGKPWTPTEDQELREAFDQGTPIKELARRYRRTDWAIQSRLERLGKTVSSPLAMRRPFSGRRTAESAAGSAYP